MANLESPPGRVHTSTPSRPYKQDLPPKGGYSAINFKRIPARQIVNAPILISGFLASQAIGWYLFSRKRRVWRREEIEESSSRIALAPLLAAERDREYLKHLRNVRDAEADLMKDVPGWEVGTWFGQPVFKTNPEDTFERLSLSEFYVHCQPRKFKSEMNYRTWLHISDGTSFTGGA